MRQAMLVLKGRVCGVSCVTEAGVLCALTGAMHAVVKALMGVWRIHSAAHASICWPLQPEVHCPPATAAVLSQEVARRWLLTAFVDLFWPHCLCW